MDKKAFPIPYLIILMAGTFGAIIAELVPPGVLPDIAQSLGIPLTQAGNIVGYYALATALATIPMTLLTRTWPRKPLYLAILVVYILSNLVIGLSQSFLTIMGARIIGGIAIAAFWPMITIYGLALSDPEYHGRTITFVMAGGMLGILLGLPLFTLLGQVFSWRLEFIMMAVYGLILAGIVWKFLPDVSGEETGSSFGFKEFFHNKAILFIFAMTLVTITAHYAAYIYITQVVAYVNYSPGVVHAQLLYGVGSFLAVVFAIVFVDRYLQGLTVFLIGSGALAFGILAVGDLDWIYLSLAFILWGLSYGSLSTVLTSAVTKQVDRNLNALNSIQSTLFNISIMVGTQVGAFALAHLSVGSLLWGSCLALGLATLAFILASFVYK